jgi:caffeoyl-CoA O-methyltransferase
LMHFIHGVRDRYKAYYDLLLSSSNLLGKGGVMLADNVLFKGLVLNSERKNPPGGKKLNHWKQRWQAIADDLHTFNAYVNRDPRTEVVLLPVRDGLTLIRKVS